MDILDIEVHGGLKGWIPPRCNLPQAGHSRNDVQPRQMLNCISGKIIQRMRPRPHEAHLTFQYVPQLRKFVQTVAPQKSSDSRDSRIIRDFEERSLSLISLS